MRNKFLCLALLLATAVFNSALSTPAMAGPRSLYLTNAWHYAKSHKLELLVDASMFAASATDVETSYRAQHQACGCVVETNPLLPARPSRAQLWGVKLPFDVGLSVINHYTANARNDDGRPTLPYKVWAIPSVGWDVAQAIAAHHNASKIR